MTNTIESKLQERHMVHESNTWDLTPLFLSAADWQKEFQDISSTNLNEISAPFQEKKSLSPQDVKSLFDLFFSYERRVKKIYTYAHLIHDTDTSNNESKDAYKKAQIVYMQFIEAFSWIEPKLLSMGNEYLQTLLQDPILAEYHIALERIIRVKEHTLSENEERLLAMAAKATGTGGKAFRALSDTDFVFGEAEDSNGKKHQVTHASYGLLLRSQDRILRKNAFISLHSKFLDYKNTLCELLSGEIEQHVFYSKAKRFSSCLDAALFPKSIDVQVYKSLIQAVRKHLPLLHSYMKTRKEILGVDTLHMWDLYVPLIQEVNINMNYDEAVSAILQSLKPMGEKYTSILEKGLTSERWVDRYENKAKRSGAYSSGCYDSHPYILMNYKGILRDVFTLAHEAGHSMHSYLSRQNQPYHYADYEIFVAEVASTFNEALLAQHLLTFASNNQEKAYIINEKLEDIRGTLFRQTMFAEFELFIHESIEKNIPLTPALLQEYYLQLNKEYFGPYVTIDPEISIEWARIPHFYYNFYVYQYATGISAAFALVDRIEKEGKKARDEYIRFLEGGCSLFPIDLLIEAGVNMNTPEPVERAMSYFSSLLQQFQSLYKP